MSVEIIVVWVIVVILIIAISWFLESTLKFKPTQIIIPEYTAIKKTSPDVHWYPKPRRFPLPAYDEILRPWWTHPRAQYKGRHWGHYQFGDTNHGGVVIPYDLRQVKLKPYSRYAGGIVITSQSLPDSVTMRFSE